MPGPANLITEIKKINAEKSLLAAQLDNAKEMEQQVLKELLLCLGEAGCDVPEFTDPSQSEKFLFETVKRVRTEFQKCIFGIGRLRDHLESLRDDRKQGNTKIKALEKMIENLQRAHHEKILRSQDKYEELYEQHRNLMERCQNLERREVETWEKGYLQLKETGSWGL